MADQPIQTSVAVAPVRSEGISARNWLERLLPYASVAVLFTALSIVSGAAWGLLNSLVITLLKVSPFIATLGTMGVARGITLVITGGLPVTSLPASFGELGDGNILRVIPVPLAILIVLALVTGFILKYTRMGRYAYAIGSNVEAARYSGIPIRRYLISIYVFGGALTGLAGMIEFSRLMTGQPTAGQGYELSVIAAVVIGGASLSGGEGTVAGTIAGAFLMSLISCTSTTCMP